MGDRMEAERQLRFKKKEDEERKEEKKRLSKQAPHGVEEQRWSLQAEGQRLVGTHFRGEDRDQPQQEDARGAEADLPQGMGWNPYSHLFSSTSPTIRARAI